MCDKEQHNPVSGLFSTYIFNILAVAQKTKVDVAPEREWGKEIQRCEEREWSHERERTRTGHERERNQKREQGHEPEQDDGREQGKQR